MGEPSTQTDGLGERRRRREAERARRAQEANGSRPLTRRELRALEMEEQARREAIATGELHLGEPGEPQPASPVSPTGASPEAVPTAQSSSAVPSGQTPPLAPTAQSASAVPSAHSAALAPTAQSASAVPTAQTPAAAPSAHSPGSAAHAPSADTPNGVSRRAMRDRLRDVPAEPEPPAARTATGRRPVRTPSTARAVRTLGPSGQLSGVQPVTRDEGGRGGTATATAVRVATQSSTDPTAWESALDLPPVATERTSEADALLVETAVAEPLPAIDDDERAAQRRFITPPGGTERQQPAAMRAAGAEATQVHPAPELEEDEEDDDGQPLRPRWAAVASAASPSSAGSWAATEDAPVLERRSVRDQLSAGPAVAASTAHAAQPASEEDWGDEEAEEPSNPAVTALKYLVLIVAGVVIGVLVAVLAFSDIGPAGAAALDDLGGQVAALVAPPGS